MENIKKLAHLLFEQYTKTINNGANYEEMDVLIVCAKQHECKLTNDDGYSHWNIKHESLFDLNKSLKVLNELNYIGNVFRTGGYSGGNCWEGEAMYEREENLQIDNDYLDFIIEKIAPDLSYLQYKKIEKSIVKTEYTLSGYYGNNDTYQVHMIELNQLLKSLSEAKVLVSEEQATQLLHDLTLKSETIELEKQPQKNKL